MAASRLRRVIFRDPITLRSHLTVLVLVTIIPLIIFSGLMIYLLGSRERDTFERGATERTLAVLTAVDTELKSSITTLEALAALRHFDKNDIQSFREDAARVLKSQPDWLTINLAVPAGQQVLNLLRPPGSALPMNRERQSFEQVLRTGKPTVGNLIQGPVTQRQEFSVRVPVMRDGVTKYVLSAVVKPETIVKLILAQQLPPDWIGVVLDGNQRFVERTIASDRAIGQLASESLRGALARSAGGWFYGTTIEGWKVYTAYNRSAFSGWSVAIGIPESVVDTPLHGPIFYISVFGAALMGAGLALAWLLSSKAATSIESLVRLVTNLGLGRDTAAAAAAANDVPTRVSEVEHLKEAFLGAARLIRERSEDRDRLEEALRQDITQRERAERFLRAQIATSRALTESDDIKSATPKIVQAVCELTGWEVGAIWDVDQQAGELKSVEVWHLPGVNVPEFEAASGRIRFAPGVGLAGRVWASGESAWMPDVTKDSNFLRVPQALQEGLHAGVCFPIKVGTAVLGVVECFSREIREPDDECLQTLTNTGNQIGQFIERKRAEQALAEVIRRKEALYQFLERRHRAASVEEMADAALDAILLALRSDRAAILLLDESRAMRFVASRGLSENYRRAVEGHSPWQPEEPDPQPVCVPDVAAADVDKSLKAALASEGIGAVVFIPLVVNGKLAGKFMIYYDGPHVFGDEELELGLTIARQLALGIERSRAEEALKERPAELQTIFDILPVGITIAHDPKGDRISVNAWFEHLLGLRDGQNASLTAPDREMLPYRCVRNGEEIPGNEFPMQLAVTGKQVREMKFDVELANSQVLNLMVNAAPLFDEQGNVRGAVGAHVDITRLKQAEAALKKFNEDLEKLVADRTEGLMQLNARWSIASPSVRSSKTNCASRKRWKRWARLPPAWRMISTIFFTSFRHTLPC